MSWPGPGSPGVNVWSVRTDSAPLTGQENLQQALDAIHAFYTSIKDVFCPGWKADLGIMVDRETQEYQTGTWTTITSAATGYQMPPANQIVVSWRTTLAARRGMGRTFLGPLADDNRQTDGTVIDSRITLIKNTAQTLVSQSTDSTNGWAIGVWGLEKPSKETGLKPADAPHLHRDVVGYNVRDQFAVLRSRRD